MSAPVGTEETEALYIFSVNMDKIRSRFFSSLPSCTLLIRQEHQACESLYVIWCETFSLIMPPKFYFLNGQN